MKKWAIALLVIFTLIFIPKLGLAQTSPIEIIILDTQVMPEYDTPDILVLYSIHFKNTSSQPYNGDFIWRIPKNTISQIVVDKTKGDNHIQFNLRQNPEYDEMVWKFSSPLQPGETKTVQLEYYYNNLQGSPDKTFAYEFIPLYKIQQAQIVMLQPLRASNFKMTPDFGQPQTGSEGFQFYKKQFLNLQPNEPIKIEASYTKADSQPSITAGQSQTPGGQGGTARPFFGIGAKVVFFFLTAFVAILVLVIYKASTKKVIQQLEEKSVGATESLQFKTSKMARGFKTKEEKLKHDFQNGRINEEEYLLKLEELNEKEEE